MGLFSDAAGDVRTLLPGTALFENACTVASTEPQFGATAATASRIGIVATMQGGVPAPSRQ